MISPNKKLRKTIQRILLVSPPGKITLTGEGSRERKLAVPPLGLAYLAAHLENNGYTVEILDTLIEGYDQERVHNNIILYGLDNASVQSRIAKFDPDLVGVSCLFSNRGQEALDLCRVAKETAPDTHVVFGGQHPSGIPSLVNKSYIDYILYGEAENALLSLIQTINSQGNLEKVPQIVLKNGHSYWKSPQTEWADVNILPLPAWEKVLLDKYWEAKLSEYEVSDSEYKKFMVMIASRGCPHDCYFCTAPMMSDKIYRRRSNKDVISEIKLYQKKYGVQEIHFWDDNFFINKGRVKEFLKDLVDQSLGLKFQVPSGAEVNCLDDEVIDLLAKAGFSKVFLAIESANQEIQLQNIDKKVKLQRVPQVIEKIKSVGMIAEGSFMVGFPKENKDQIDHTFDQATKLGLDRISISIVNPLPGTGLYEECEEKELLPNDFDVQNIRWSQENITLTEIPNGYLSKKRRDIWLKYMQDKINVEQYEIQNLKTDPKINIPNYIFD